MPFLLLALAILCLSQPANLVRWAQAPTQVIGFWRLFIAACVLAPFAWSRRAGWSVLAPRERALTFAAGGLFFLHLWAFFFAAKHTRVANCMIAFSVHPLFTAVGARFFFAEPVTLRLLAAYALAAVGLCGLFSGSVGFGGVGLVGDLVAVLSAFLFSGYVLCGRRVRERLDNSIYASVVYFTGALLFGASGVLSGVRWLGYPDSTWLAVLGLGLGVTLGGHALFTYLLRSLNVNLLSLAKLLEPVGAALVAYWAFGEALETRTLWAFGCIAAALLILVSPTPSKTAQPVVT